MFLENVKKHIKPGLNFPCMDMTIVQHIMDEQFNKSDF